MTNSFIRLIDNTLNMPERPSIQSTQLVELMGQIKKGTIRIPDFQRGYIWTKDQVKELLESVWNGYPLGSILLWKTGDMLHERDPLQIKLPDLPQGNERLYLLDGQQRLISLYSVLNGTLRLGKTEPKIPHYGFFNLDNETFVIASDEDLKETHYALADGFLPLDKLMTFSGQNSTSTSLDSDVLDQLSGFSKRIQKYNALYNSFVNLTFATITTGQCLSVACSIFERLNNTGTKLTVADLMVAITYEHDFNLRDKLSDYNDQLNTSNFSLDERTILQCISACLKKGTEKDDIIESAKEVRKNWQRTTQSIGLSIDFLKKHQCVPTSNFLPYEALLAPLTYFFYLNSGRQLDHEKIKLLKKYFWLNLFSERYTSSQPSKSAEDIENMVKVMGNSNVPLFNYYDQQTITKEKILETDVSSGSFALSVICFLASKKPLEFLNNSEVSLDQTLAEANRRQLHHIFPINYMKKHSGKQSNYDTEIKPYINSVANISLISRSTNRDIWDSEPSVYFAKFEKANAHIQDSLDSHLIGGIDDFGIRNNDFNVFINKRAQAIADSINLFASSLK